MTSDTLVDPGWLWDRRDNPHVLAVGCSYEGFALGHLPGVVLPIHVWLKDTPLGTEIVPADEFARAMGSLGVNEHTTVVTYDDFDGTLAARLWWVLRYYGHARARVLDGGWHRWVVEEFPLSQEERPQGEALFVPAARSGMTCSADELLERLRTGTATAVDVRPRDHWEGSDPNIFGNRRQGRIPGSVHLDLDSLITEHLRTMRSPDELRALLERAGIPETGEVVFYCQAGVAAALGALVLDVLGRNGGLVYEASMAEWANRDDTPLECG
jgi:thiosulfate/3-mercaptopyruvate sulfurtransferase